MLEKILKQKKILIIASTIVFVIFIGLILFYNIPRLEYYYESKTDSYTVTRVYGDAKKYVIPATHEGKKVTKIGVRAFYQHHSLEEIVFEDNNIINVSRLAFAECHNLKSIDLSGVEVIERNAFSYCINLDNLIINARNVAGSAFFGCRSLKNISFSNKVESLGSMAFGQTGLVSISIPSSINDLNSNCFCDCDNLEEIKVYGDALKQNSYLLSLDIVTFID